MSVAHFDSDELANVARYLTASQYSGPEHVAKVVADLATWSRGNTWAFCSQYGEGSATAVSASEIDAAMRRISLNRARAKGSIRLLAYNGITNAGHEAKVRGYRDALARILGDAFSRVLDEQEAA
jgi:hypothetical protein